MNTICQMLRLHQWVKNCLLFVPLFAAHQLKDANAWWALGLAFFSFSFCASAVYIINDLLDLNHDRLHPHKKNRPFAAGKVPRWIGALLIPVLLLISLGLGIYVNQAFLQALALYFILCAAYSWQLKRFMYIDCITLAILYTLRLVAGGAASGTTLSLWLLAFSSLLFLSLSFVKRYAELQVQHLNQQEKISAGRGYHTADAPFIRKLGISAAYACILVLCLYINSEQIMKFYHYPKLVWASVPILLFWLARMWNQAKLGHIQADPVVFAMHDKLSLLAGLAFMLVVLVGWAPSPT